MKIVATSFSLGSGGSGGVLGPSIFIGGMIGALVGTVANGLFPSAAGTVGGYTLVGMAAFLAPVVGAPLTAILILFEMTGDYAIILPLLVAVISAMLVSGRISRFSLYTHSLHKKGVDLVRGREEGVLKTIFVRDVMRKEILTIPASASFRQISEKFLVSPVDYFYLIDANGALIGPRAGEGCRDLESRFPHPGGNAFRRPDQVRIQERGDSPRGIRPAHPPPHRDHP